MFNRNKIKDDCVRWIKNFFEENGAGCNAVVGISGGKDSSVVAALCTEALGKERVIGVLMPCGKQDDIDMAYKLVEHLGIMYYVINIEPAVEAVRNSLLDLSKILRRIFRSVATSNALVASSNNKTGASERSALAMASL